ncbi:MAG: hypothetical protein AB1801_00685 [Chloroflexota bacterium]
MNQHECSHLTGYVQRVEDLCPVQRDQMYTLLTRYFANTTRPGFDRDLAEKEWVIVLTDAATGQMRGFSTLMRLRVTVDGQAVTAFFSGDTIIQREYWGDTALPRLWAQHVFSLAGTIRQAKVYWFLICSGYKTYRFLSVFFRVFYPNYQQCPPPAIKKLLDTLGRLKFPTEYDPAAGVVRLAQRTPLRPGVAEITARHLKDPHIAFFAAANPGHIYGDELACLAEIDPANLTPAGRRMLGQL